MDLTAKLTGCTNDSLSFGEGKFKVSNYFKTLGEAPKKLLRIMKITSILILATALQVSATGYSQKVTLNLRDVSLDKVFKEIKRQSGYMFLYDNGEVKKLGTVSVSVKDATVDEALSQALASTSYTYKIVENTIVLTPKPTLSAPSPKVEVGDEVIPTLPIKIRVTDADGEPLIGATITVKKSKNTGVTNAEGVSTLNLEVGDVVTVSFVGYASESFTIKDNSSTLTISLKRNESPLDEIQIGAYTKTSKRLQVGNVATVKGEDIQKQPVTNVLQALENRVPGLYITQTNGINGGGVVVRIQGENSLRNGSNPLYVIDGVPFFSYLPSTGADAILGNSGGKLAGGPDGNGSPLAFLNAYDIESVDILKDADATAIYGSRAGNGAILITTKRGKPGRIKVNFNLQNGWSIVSKMADLLNTQQYLEMRREAFRNDGLIPSSNPTASGPFKYAPDLTIWDTTRYTDWQNEIIGGTAQFTNINLDFSGGNTNLQYLLGATYNKSTTVFPGNFADKKGAVHFNITSSSVNKKFNMQFTGNYLVGNNLLPRGDLTSYVFLAPNAPSIFNADGTLNWAPNSAGSSTWDNPIKNTLGSYQNTTNSLIGNLTLNYLVCRGLNLKMSAGYTNVQTNDIVTTPLVTFAPELRSNIPPPRSATYGDRGLNTWIIEPQLLYKRRLLGGNLSFLGGTTIQYTKSNVFSTTGNGYSSDQLLQSIAAAATHNATNSIAEQKYNALFGNLSYSLQSKYIINLNARRDGSSRFGPESRFHNFWSAGGAWTFSEYAGFKKAVPFISFGKLKGSYGTTGSDQVGDYSYLDLFNPIGSVPLPYQGTSGLAPNRLVNPSQQWEETRKISLGISLGFCKDRILFDFNHYRNRSSNQIIGYNISTVTGFSTINLNLPATVQNTGWEFSLVSSNIKTKDFTWSTNINLTIGRNKIISFDDLSFIFNPALYVVGQPASFTKLYHFLGVNPVTGLYLVADSRGNPTNTPSATTDKTVFHTNYPTYYGGFSNTFNYKGLQLDVFWSFANKSQSNFIFTSTNAAGSFAANGTSNQFTTVLERWQKPGDIATIQRLSTAAQSNSAVSSDANYENAFFARLKNLSLSYQLPASMTRKMHVSDCSIYIQGQNLLTLSNFTGLDPETQVVTALPPLKTFTLGLRAGF